MNLRFDSHKQMVMKRYLFIVMVVFVGVASAQLMSAQTPTAPDEKRAPQPKKRGGIFTMYVVDPLARTMCFSDGKEGFAFVNNEWRNRCSDLSYILASNGSLASGIEVNRVAAIVDLGTPDELRQRLWLRGRAGRRHRVRFHTSSGRQDHGPEARPWQARVPITSKRGTNSLRRLLHLPPRRSSWATFTSCVSRTRKTRVSSSSLS